MTQSFGTVSLPLWRPACMRAALVLAVLSCARESTAPVVVPTQLVFATPPVSTVAGASISPAIAITAKDASGNTATTFAGSVTLAFGANPGGSTLSGTVTVAAVAGVATFSSISLNKVGTGYTLVASSGALTPATSAAFGITRGAATTLAIISGNGQGSFVGALLQPLRVMVTDAFANVVPGATVNWAALTGGGSVGAPMSVTDATGVAATTWTLGATVGSQTARAMVSGLLLDHPRPFTASATAFAFASIAAGYNHTCGAHARRHSSVSAGDTNVNGGKLWRRDRECALHPRRRS